MIEVLKLLLGILLILGATLRITRFFVTDELGQRLVNKLPKGRVKDFIIEMTDCIFCTSVWVSFAVVATWIVLPDPYSFYVLAPFAVAWVTAHIGLRVGDAGYDED